MTTGRVKSWSRPSTVNTPRRKASHGEDKLHAVRSAERMPQLRDTSRALQYGATEVNVNSRSCCSLGLAFSGGSASLRPAHYVCWSNIDESINRKVASLKTRQIPESTKSEGPKGAPFRPLTKQMPGSRVELAAGHRSHSVAAEQFHGLCAFGGREEKAQLLQARSHLFSPCRYVLLFAFGVTACHDRPEIKTTFVAIVVRMIRCDVEEAPPPKKEAIDAPQDGNRPSAAARCRSYRVQAGHSGLKPQEHMRRLARDCFLTVHACHFHHFTTKETLICCVACLISAFWFHHNVLSVTGAVGATPGPSGAKKDGGNVYLESQVAQNSRPVYPKASHY